MPARPEGGLAIVGAPNSASAATAQARGVASLGLFPAAVPLFAGRSDSAARFYAGFRRRQTSGLSQAIWWYNRTLVESPQAAR